MVFVQALPLLGNCLCGQMSSWIRALSLQADGNMCVAVCCSVLQCVAVCCWVIVCVEKLSVWADELVIYPDWFIHSLLQRIHSLVYSVIDVVECVATHCNALQHTATHSPINSVIDVVESWSSFRNCLGGADDWVIAQTDSFICYNLLHLDCHLILISNLDLIGLFSTQHDKRDLEN